MPGQGQVLPAFLVNGFVRGTWALKERRLWISPFRALSKADSAAVLEETARLLPFLVDDTTADDIAVN